MDKHLLRQIQHQPNLSKVILHLGIPTGLQMVTTSMAGLVIVGLVNRHGAEATAAYGAVNQVLKLYSVPCAIYCHCRFNFCCTSDWCR